jgi:NADH dehydrogenase
MTGFGGMIWLVMAVLLNPLADDTDLAWQAADVANVLPQLIAYLLLGSLVGGGYGLLYARRGKEWALLAPAVEMPTSKRHVVILGGGYAGVSAAQALERELATDPTVVISLVSETNYLVHTPMLSEVSASAVNAQNISPPLRNFFDRVKVIQGGVQRVDLERRVVHLSSNARSRQRELPFDHLLLTVGSVPNFYGNADVAKHALTFKSLYDAIRVRSQVIEMFERADIEEDAAQRRQMLTFIVTGGGFAGVELIGGLNNEMTLHAAFYPSTPTLRRKSCG